MVREVSESCVDSLLTEMVACYCNRFYANKPELAARRIEAIGYQVGHQLSERYTMERPRFTDHLEAIKFICKDFWSELFKKQIDNLKTNHRIISRLIAYLLGKPLTSLDGGDNLGYTMERPRFTDHLEAIKFICKDFWSELFKKQIDNLKTNHRGTFVLQDNKFRWLARMSVDPSTDNAGSVEDNNSPTAENKAAHAMSMHLYFPCGIIRGALSNLGIPCAVSADISNLPAWGNLTILIPFILAKDLKIEPCFMF
ncbi:hypothetical protein LR48_Vigan09g157100 [Vigna angularis]|uniref:Trafficking protein particle complex subunit 6B n=1 Tax=Phaseolus angularis TaxID=3914 RepID=A0A0L9VDA4_PHAAN|nr:hypothetical protein LR48_Vigan09g157100 [Vigna angularis]